MQISEAVVGEGYHNDPTSQVIEVGLVTFEDVVNAFFARLYLDNLKLVRDNAQLRVKFLCAAVHNAALVYTTPQKPSAHDA